jgi:hypothetical protein
MNECAASVQISDEWMCICMTGENKSTQNKTCPSAILSTTDPTQTEHGLNLELCGDRLPTNTALHFPLLLRSSHTQ